MAINANSCIKTGDTTDVNYNGLPLTIGSVCLVDSGEIINICATITDVDIPQSSNLAISAYTDCYECLAQNYGVIDLSDCFRRFKGAITINGLGFIPTFGSTIYLTIADNVGDNEITSCFTVGRIRQISEAEYNQGLTNKELYIPQTTAIQETSCQSCLDNNLFTYQVDRCTDEATDYITLPSGLIGSLISYSDGTNQYCGVVIELAFTTPDLFTYVSSFGPQAECDVCLDVANDKILIQNCTNSEDQEIVWASALFENGDVSNLSNNDGCFEVIGVTEDPVTIDSFLNFDPQPGCEPCIECNGINYEYTTCSTVDGFDTGTLYPVQAGGSALNISCTEYSSGSNKIYVGTYNNPTIYVYNPLTNSVSTTMSSYYNGTRDIEYFNSTTLYSMSNSGGYSAIEKINSATDSITTVFTSNSNNYYMSTDSTNNRLFYTSYNNTSSEYETNSFNTLTNSVTHTYTTSSAYYRIKYAPNSNKVYTVSGYYEVKVLNADDLSVVTGLTFSNYLNDIEYNPCTEQMYITSNSGSEIYVIDTVSDSLIHTISTPAAPGIIKYNPNDGKMYIISIDNPPNIMVLDPVINEIIVNQNVGSYGAQYMFTDFTFYPTDNELYLPYYINFNGDYLLELPTTFNTFSGYFKSYQYLPNGSTFFNPYNGRCCEIIGTSSNYYETLYSVKTFDDCETCQTCNGQVWEAYGCGVSTGTTFNVLVDGGLHQGDIVKLMWGSNDWICAELQNPISTNSNYYENYYNSSRDSSGNTKTYQNCASCMTTSRIGLTLVNCDTGIEKFVSISVDNYIDLNSLGNGIPNYVINDTSGCYNITNFCPIPLSATTEFTPVQFFAYCSLCSPADPSRSANTESFVCVICCDCGATGSTITQVSPPHPVWSDGYGTPVTQLNMITLGGMNGLNS
jgi:hypothetical protein